MTLPWRGPRLVRCMSTSWCPAPSRAILWEIRRNAHSGSMSLLVTMREGGRSPPSTSSRAVGADLAMWNNRSAYRQPFPETADHLFASGAARRSASSSGSTHGPPMAVHSS